MAFTRCHDRWIVHCGVFDMTTIILSEEPSDTDAVLSALNFDAKWLIELSNDYPRSFIGREAELYSIMNALQLVTSRFAKVA